MRGLAWFLVACLCWCALSMPSSAAERQVARYQGLTASVDSGFGCARSASITVRAPEASAYTGDRIALQRLLGTARAGLGADCPILREIDIAGYAAETPAFQATISAEDGWRLPAGAGHLETADFVSPLARAATTCDYERSDPFVGCWVQLLPEQFSGLILNIRRDGTWYWERPEKLADGTFEHIGQSITRNYMYGAGPYLEFIDQKGWRTSFVGPLFRDECSIMRLGAYTPFGVDMFGPSDDQLLLRLRAPLTITADIFNNKEDSEDYDDGSDDEMNDESQDYGDIDIDNSQIHDNCVDNFNEDIANELILDAALLLIPAFEMPTLMSPRYLGNATRIARQNPYKYRKFIYWRNKSVGRAFSKREITASLNLSKSKSWPRPPGKGPFKEGLPSRSKPAARGEKSLYDSEGGEWRPHLPDKYHSEGHWSYKPPGKNTPWQNIDIHGKLMD